jgi:hypothetical protein
LDHSLVTAFGITGRKRRTTCTIEINKAKHEQLKPSKTDPSMWP